MTSILDRIIVHANRPTCGSQIGAPHVQVRTIRLFACGCGTIVGADMPSVEAQAIIGLAVEGDTASTKTASEPAQLEVSRRALGRSPSAEAAS